MNAARQRRKVLQARLLKNRRGAVGTNEGTVPSAAVRAGITEIEKKPRTPPSVETIHVACAEILRAAWVDGPPVSAVVVLKDGKSFISVFLPSYRPTAAINAMRINGFWHSDLGIPTFVPPDMIAKVLLFPSEESRGSTR